MRAKIKLYNQDCMEAMKDMADNQFDLAIVDPPYGINISKQTMGRGSGNDLGRHKRKSWDNNIPDSLYFQELKRISAEQILWGGNYYLEHLGSSRCFLLWDKIDYNSDFASHEMAWTSFNKNTKCFRRARTLRDDLKVKIHPTQKPVALYKWLLQNYAKEGDKILDTHLGSGSIAIACWDLKFDLTGYELDKEYYDGAVKRFNIHCKQGQLF